MTVYMIVEEVTPKVIEMYLGEEEANAVVRNHNGSFAYNYTNYNFHEYYIKKIKVEEIS